MIKDREQIKLLLDDIKKIQMERRRLFDAKKTERIELRVTPGIMEWLREQGNMSKYIFRLIKDDMIENGGK